MAIDPIELSNDLDAAVARARRALAAKGGLTPPVAGPYVSPLDDEERKAVLELIESGEYARAVAEVVADDPELAG